NLIAAMPVAEEAKVPMFAPLVGTTSVRLKHNRYLFHVRASYKTELARITQQLAVVGNDKVAVVYQDSVFGKSNLDTLLELITASIVTSPTQERYGIVKEYRKALGTSAGEGDNYTVIEGYIVAKAFVEGLRRAGRALTRENFIAALEGFGNLDLGDYRVDY